MFVRVLVITRPGWAPGAAYMTGKAAEGAKAEDPKLEELAREIVEKRKA